MTPFSDAYMWHLRKVNIGFPRCQIRRRQSLLCQLNHKWSIGSWRILFDQWQLVVSLNIGITVTMVTMVSQITGVSVVCSNFCSGADQRKRHSASLAFVRGNHRWPVHSPHRVPVTRKMFPFNDIIMAWRCLCNKPLSKPVNDIHVVPLTQKEHDLIAQI